MKTLNITFTDKEFRFLLKAKRSYSKNNLTWYRFILLKCLGNLENDRR